MYNDWEEGPESIAVHELIEEMSKIKYDNGTVDIVDDFQPFLNKLHNLVATLKVPGRKAKQYE